MALANERFAMAADAIRLLHGDDCFQRFHTARVMSG
jgi:hypothetical protein